MIYNSGESNLAAMILTIQYLEPSPDLDQLDALEVRRRLGEAQQVLPFTHVLIGWNVPAQLVDACREEAGRLGMKFLRWQPLLSGDGHLRPLREWRVVGLNGLPVPAWQDRLEFTFLCPNNPGVQYAVQDRIDQLVKAGGYDGFFLDRIRFPSPARDPRQELGCFCEHCRRKAADQGLELVQVHNHIVSLLDTDKGRIDLVESLLESSPGAPGAPAPSLLERFWRFRMSGITHFVQMITESLLQARLEVGLDCWTPSLTKMVGQDAAALGSSASWLKGMTYAHTMAPAGMPFELLALADFLLQGSGLAEQDILARIGKACFMPLPATRAGIRREGISPHSLAGEVAHGVVRSGAPYLAGIELVDLPAVVDISRAQVEVDLQAVSAVGPAGLAISWDLLDIPLERLGWVRPYLDIKPAEAACR
jgi:hypothetical protein